MTKLKVAKVSCSFTVVKCQPLNPFVWLVLEVLQAFPEGKRPSGDELAEKLGIDEKGFFEQGWSEILESEELVIFEDGYQDARLSEEGERVLQDGIWTEADEEPEERLDHFYFKLNNGEIIAWRHTMKEEGAPRPIAQVPGWHSKLDEGYIIQAIEAQRGQEEHLDTATNRMLNLRINWEESGQVDLTL